ncbi:Hypothetical_protein [Hexamita inflata]|uniref:Hypothetical_protein n=1 Tax=Hexamita inflata TaxID=28002 RepID=A0ABP1HQI5_9EUKA
MLRDKFVKLFGDVTDCWFPRVYQKIQPFFYLQNVILIQISQYRKTTYSFYGIFTILNQNSLVLLVNYPTLIEGISVQSTLQIQLNLKCSEVTLGHSLNIIIYYCAVREQYSFQQEHFLILCLSPI